MRPIPQFTGGFEVHDDLRHYRPMFEAIERRVLATVEMAAHERLRAATVIAVAGLGLCLGQSGEATGWATLLNNAAAQAELNRPGTGGDCDLTRRMQIWVHQGSSMPRRVSALFGCIGTV
jgi:hypothetical protein